MWVKLDDAFFRNPKVRKAGPVGASLYLCGLCHCAGSLTDGWIAHSDVGLLLAEAQTTRATVTKLVEAGLWVEVAEHPEHYWVPDYLTYNPSRADVVTSREQAQARRARGGRRSRDGTGDAQATLAGTSVAPSRPVPSERETREPYIRDFETAWAKYPRKIAKAQAFKAYQARRREGIPTAQLLTAVTHYAQDCEAEHRETRYRLHGSTFFGSGERWKDYSRANGARPARSEPNYDRGGST